MKRKDVIEFFKSEGFTLMHGTRHGRLVHPDGRWTTLGRHQEIPNTVFKEMKKQAGIK